MGLRENWNWGDSERGVSPVIGVIVMVSVAVIVAGTIGAAALGLGDDLSDPAPQTKFDVEETDDGIQITHESGDSINGDEIKLAGAATDSTISEWEGETVESGDTATVNTEEGELEIIWEGSEDSSATLSEAEVPNTEPGAEICRLDMQDGIGGGDVTVDTGDFENLDEAYMVTEYISEHGPTMKNPKQTVDPNDKNIVAFNSKLYDDEEVIVTLYKSEEEYKSDEDNYLGRKSEKVEGPFGNNHGYC